MMEAVPFSAPSPSTVEVRLDERSYTIHIDAGNLKRIGPLTAEAVKGRRAFVVTHPVLSRAHGGAVRDSLEAAGFRVCEAVLPPGERQKSMFRLTDLCRRMLNEGLDRNSVLIALGGGVIGDLGGLTAALFMRGIPYVQVPTSLLAMVDSSVGGKTAVDLGDAKNAVGTFHQPRLVVIDPLVLKTLPVREVRAGLAEVVKYGLLGDRKFFDWIRDHARDLVERDPEAVSHAIRRSCEMKADVVERDEFDRLGLRAALNLGHTVGHAVEALGGYHLYRHGEAIAIGTVAACMIAERMDVAAEPVAEPAVQVLEAVGLPTKPKRPVDPDALLSAMLKDKKTTDGVLNFVLPRRIGEVVNRPVPADLVLEVVAEQGVSG